MSLPPGAVFDAPSFPPGRFCFIEKIFNISGNEKEEMHSFVELSLTLYPISERVSSDISPFIAKENYTNMNQSTN